LPRRIGFVWNKLQLNNNEHFFCSNCQLLLSGRSSLVRLKLPHNDNPGGGHCELLMPWWWQPVWCILHNNDQRKWSPGLHMSSRRYSIGNELRGSGVAKQCPHGHLLLLVNGQGLFMQSGSQ
jgi:hypothetical protein